MGYGEFGGGGSVKWELDIDDTPGKKKVKASGRDDRVPDYFEVTIEYDNATTAGTAWTNMTTALQGLGSNAKKLVFRIPFEDDDHHNVKVEWP